MSFTLENNQDRIGFVHQWAAYVHSHPDQVWSKQQNVIINAALQSADRTREQFFKMKGETHYQK